MTVADVVSSQTAPHRYIITRTWTATDACGNAITASQVITVYDDVAPVFTNVTSSVFHCYEDNTSGTYTVPSVTGSDVCSGGVTYNYVVTGATARSGNSNNATGSFNVGASLVTWTLTDVSGNTTTATTLVMINPPITVDIPTVTVLPQGALPNTIYYGYTPASVLTVSAVPSGGTAPYTYKWSVSLPNLVVTVPNASQPQTVKLSSAVAGSYTVTVVITDSKGCTATFTKAITVMDIRCGAAMDKVLVCRSVGPPAIPPGGGNGNGHPHGGGNGGGNGGGPTPPDNCITASTVATQLANGATLGPCPVTQAKGITEEVIASLNSIKTYPNPTTGIFQLQLVNYKPARVQVQIINGSGKIVASKVVQVSHRNESMEFNIGAQASGIYIARVVSEEGVQTAKVIMAK
jgi:hypothetical protein